MDGCISKIEYVQLNLNDSIMIANVLDMCIAKDYIFVLPSRSNDGVLQFTRTGDFIRSFGELKSRMGEIMMPQTIYTDEQHEKLYVSTFGSLFVYDLLGNCIDKIDIKRPYSYQYLVGDNKIAEVGREYVPCTAPGIFSLGVFDLNTTDTIAIRPCDMISEVPAEITGIKQVIMSNISNGLLAHFCCSDTIFELTASGIYPRYYLNMDNSHLSKIESYKIRNEQEIDDTDIQLWDFIELNNYLLYRYIENGKMNLCVYDKESERFFRRVYADNLNNIVGLNRKMTMLGIGAKKGILPFYPTKILPKEKMAIQYYSVSEILYLKENNKIDSVDFDDIEECDNPILVFYYLN